MRFGKWRDTYEARRHPDGAAIVLAHALNVLGDVNHGVDAPVDGEGEEAPLDEGPRPECEIEPDFDALYPDDRSRPSRNAPRIPQDAATRSGRHPR